PHSIIEVDAAVVESFLGRIGDPVKAQNTELNIINDPAFRIIMVTGFEGEYLKYSESDLNDANFENYHKSVIKLLIRFNGSLIKKKSDCFLISFEGISDAVYCAIEIQTTFKKFINDHNFSDLVLKIGLSAGVPVTEKKEIFEDTIKLAERLCNVVNGQIVVSAEVKDLFESENLNVTIDKELVRTLHPSDEKFLNVLMDFTEQIWNKTDLKVDDFSRNLGLSKSQLYRKLKAITGKSLNTFVKEYRLNKALMLLEKQKGNISEIAFETGFNSPAYFSKCFQETYGVLPSSYSRQY
ncbi:MAG: helix-turn-helix domain-containing protein, partial [Flavobacteriaceae bacterium]|nr:helix-turn-helix domain-containing protein [Flavobacteriaceae bacterium]